MLSEPGDALKTFCETLDKKATTIVVQWMSMLILVLRETDAEYIT